MLLMLFSPHVINQSYTDAATVPKYIDHYFIASRYIELILSNDIGIEKTRYLADALR